MPDSKDDDNGTLLPFLKGKDSFLSLIHQQLVACFPPMVLEEGMGPFSLREHLRVHGNPSGSVQTPQFCISGIIRSLGV